MTLGDRTDEELLALAATKDPDALEEFYRRHVGKGERFASRRCRRPAEVPDLVAAVWLEVVESAARFDPARGRAVPWLFGTAANLIASSSRRRMREQQARSRLGGRQIMDQDDFARVEDQMEATGFAQELKEAISELPEGERIVVELVAIDGLTPGQAAEAVGISSAAARMRLARGRMKLRRSLSTIFLSSSPLKEGSA